MALMLEIVDRAGRLRARTRLETFPLAVGRGYDNDIILDDPYVEARHARIEATPDGEVVLRDVGSVNPVRRGGEPAPEVVLRPGCELRLGRTILRFRDTAEAVAPALPDRARELPRPLRWLGSGSGRLAVFAAAIALMAVSTWLESYDRSGGSEAFGVALGTVLLLAFWSLIWAVGGRLAVQRAAFSGHLAIASAGLLALLLYGMVAGWIEFLFPDAPLLAPVGLMAAFGGAVALLAAHLSLASSMEGRRRLRVAVGIAAVAFGVGAAAALVDGDTYTDVPTFSAQLKPMTGRWIPTVTPTEFSDVAADLRDEVDALAKEMEERSGG